MQDDLVRVAVFISSRAYCLFDLFFTSLAIFFNALFVGKIFTIYDFSEDNIIVGITYEARLYSFFCSRNCNGCQFLHQAVA